MNSVNQINIIAETAKCCGCFACVQICSLDAISIYEDKKGHLYPKIDSDKCVDCKKCSKVCPALQTHFENHELSFFGIQHKNPELLKKSSSGGLFVGLAEVIFSMGGVCYGAAYQPDFSVAHKRAVNIQELFFMQGSKYVISNTQDTFGQVEDDLKNGIYVLYSGTSCIIAGLYSYLKCRNVNTEKLYTCDLVCSGIPGNKILKEYIKDLERQKKSKCVAVNLRDKSRGWDKHRNRCGNVNTYYFENKQSESNNAYTELYGFRLLNRSSCFDCSYIQLAKKKADITMADFWGFEKSTSKIFYNDKGCSLAIVHSEKGAALLKQGNFRMFSIATEEEAMLRNRTQHHRQIKHHDKFWEDYEKRGLRYCIKKYTSQGGIITRLKRKILMLFKRW